MGNLRFLAGLTAVVLMSGCSTEPEPILVVPNPAASPSSEPSSAPTPTFDSKATTAVIFGTRVEFRNTAGEMVDSVRFDAEAADFVSALAKHFGATTESFQDGPCGYYNFGSGLKVSYLTDGTDIVYGNVEMFVHTAAVNGIRIETPSGVSIGEDAMALVGSVSPELKADYSGDGRTWSVVYDVATWWGLNTTEPKQYGARAGVDDGALSLIMVPANVGEMHGTC